MIKQIIVLECSASGLTKAVGSISCSSNIVEIATIMERLNCMVDVLRDIDKAASQQLRSADIEAALDIHTEVDAGIQQLFQICFPNQDISAFFLNHIPTEKDLETGDSYIASLVGAILDGLIIASSPLSGDKVCVLIKHNLAGKEGD